MNAHTAGPNPVITYLISGVIIAAVLAFRFMRSRTPQPLRIEQLWIVPVVYVLIGGFGIWTLTKAFGIATTSTDLAIMAGCLVVGALVGWWRGKLMKIDVHPDTHVVMVQPTPWALLVIVGLIAVRFAVRILFLKDVSPTSPEATSLTVDLILAAIGILAVARIEMWLRASRLLAQARAAKAAG